MLTYTQSQLEALTGFQLAEQLCRTLAYQYDKKDRSFTTSLNINQESRHFDVKKFSTHSDLATQATQRARGMIVIPERNTAFNTDENVPIWFTWTGTNSPQSILADIAEVNAGEHSYRLLEKQFLEQSLNAIVQTKKRFRGKKIELHFTGHSLGGALAQLHFATLQRAIAQCIVLETLDPTQKEKFKKQDEAYLENLKKEGSLAGIKSTELANIVQTRGIDHHLKSNDIALFKLHPWNSTGVIHATTVYTQKLIQDNADKGIPSKADHIIFLGDPVQQTGSSNIFNDPIHQDITILEVTTPTHIKPSRLAIMDSLGLAGAASIELILANASLDLIMDAYHAIKQHTGRLSLPDGSLNTEQSYRILTSTNNPQEIIDHLLTNKSQVLELGKAIQPLVFSQIHTLSVQKLVELLNLSAQQPNFEVAQQALALFIATQTQAQPIKRLKALDQKRILNAMLAHPPLLETMDRLFLQAGEQKDINTLFEVSILKEFLSNNAAQLGKQKLFDRVLSKVPITAPDALSHFSKTDALLKEFKSKKSIPKEDETQKITFHLPPEPHSPKKKR